ncbi:MAG TPA: DNA gyrase/topoisomerase IV subunit A [Cytophagales bacterium]|nr:DNA gyrase/topoisomerase IV subunit A [Cytophagales bacterium]HAP60155.1 DNA gyrase/topoisomerase IV subunit A [Cytophagales bacterium]
MAQDENETNHEEEVPQDGEGQLQDVVPLSGLYEDWFLDYASYVILERAVPAVEDGLKPVQRRIMHALKEMDDGRFNKVANVIGQTMQYHPHGDAAIGDAIVGMGQKELLLETQGNWGDIRTGDSAAAPRYIEVRLSKLALEILYNPQTTDWQLSYDGRKKEPVTFPAKFPILLAQGVEGIAVGLSTKIMPHNFQEICKASMDVLKGKKTNLLPDFLTGGMMDAQDYNEGLRGGKIRVRAHIEEHDSKTLAIKDIPYGVTTTSLIESILKANDKGKIKIKKVVDNTAKDVEILVSLAAGQSPDVTIDALYAFTDCEVSISPNACVIIKDKPVFISVNELLRINTFQTKELLRRELEIRKGELMEKLLFSSLEKIFIENRIYRDIEEVTTWEGVIETIDEGLEPWKPEFYREITRDDIIRLTEIKIKRISKYDSFKADELMRNMQEELAQVEHHLAHLTDYAIAYYQKLLDKFGKGRERRTEIRSFDTIKVHAVVANNTKLYVNRKEGFIGSGLKKDEFVQDCSDIDDIIAFTRSGAFKVVRMGDKVFVGKDIMYVGVWKKGDERTVYNAIYLDGKSGRSMVKRFQVPAITRDREYNVTKGEKGSKVLYFEARANGETEKVTVTLSQNSRARIKVFEFDFGEVDIKGRGAGGNIMTRYPVRNIKFKMLGESSLGGVDVFYDATIGRLNTDERGDKLGSFQTEDRILVVYKNGQYELTDFELTNRYEPQQVMLIEKFDPEGIISAVYKDGESKELYVKRFLIETTSLNKKFLFITDHRSSKLEVITSDPAAQLEITHKAPRKGEPEEVVTRDFDILIDVKGWGAKGNKLSQKPVKKLKLVANEKPAVEEAAKGGEDGKDDGFAAGDTIDLFSK